MIFWGPLSSKALKKPVIVFKHQYFTTSLVYFELSIFQVSLLGNTWIYLEYELSNWIY